MSYLVDALKKAERERHENQRADLRSLAGSEPTRRGTGAALRWLVGVLVACNAALLVYLFLPGPASVPFVAPTAPTIQNTTKAPVAAELESETNVSGAAALEPSNAPETRAAAEPRADVSNGSEAAPQPVAAVDRAPLSPVQDTSSSVTLPPARSASADALADSSAENIDVERRSNSRGQVTYSATPLDDDTAFMSDDSRAAPVSDSPPGNAPAIAINGHLYSSVPGRSFILVKGRRYHEGERLADGPAVESIDARGATLNYRGERYHVRGPG